MSQFHQGPINAIEEPTFRKKSYLRRLTRHSRTQSPLMNGLDSEKKKLVSLQNRSGFLNRRPNQQRHHKTYNTLHQHREPLLHTMRNEVSVLPAPHLTCLAQRSQFLLVPQ